MIGCRDVDSFAAGELTFNDAETFRAHLRDCPSCPDTLVECVQLLARLSELDLSDRVVRAECAADQPHVVDPYVHATAQLAQLARAYLIARDVLESAAWSGVEAGGASARFSALDVKLRRAVGVSPQVRPVATLRVVRPELPAPVMELPRESWWRGATRWWRSWW